MTLATQEPVAGNAAIEITDVVFGYTESRTILSLDKLALDRGGIVSLLGPSGCGKTTLLLLVAGLLKPDRGEIKLFASAPSDSLGTERLSMVFQTPSLIPWRSVEANVSLPFELLGKPMHTNLIQDALRLVGLNQVANHYVDQLSGGMRSRVALARALVTEPQLLLLDEPFGSLDEGNRLRLSLALAEIQRTLGTTVFLITHNISEAVLISDRLLVMQANRSANGAATIVADIKPAFPNKSLAAMTNPEFQRTCQAIIQLIKD